MGISHQPLNRKHSYLDHRYPGGSAFIPWLLTPGSLPQDGAKGQNLGQLKKKCFSTFSVMETIYANSWSVMAQSYDIDLWVMKWRSAWPLFHGPVILPYILKTIWYLEDYLMYEHHTLGLWVSMTRRWPKHKCRSLWHIFHDLYFTSSDFALYLEDYLMYEHHYFGLWVSITWHLTWK